MDKWHENEEFFSNNGEFQIAVSIFLCNKKVHLSIKVL
jgi:hypothetical protein